ncbi:hypothetical protein O181_070806 [Austropuccinia psidii MF-1]|uniref:Reverse transcriptase domain-containing protein n=1 Tax=Austropuccinia psidii MF-1 TaxID=1389203 RepID=A0A9Q3EZJ7_9BASI|nr:hypothetical protein [Austropuccinia psidii MF-1]
MDIILELGTRYHERKKGKGSYQVKKPPVTGSNSFRTPQEPSSKRPNNEKSKKGKNIQVPKDKLNSALLSKDNKLIGSEKERRIKEEKWDEEEKPEEVETMLNVVPASYHHYFDGFSKVKAEKLPPNHSFEHHIKLEGLLPPVGVIYYLSNHDSETIPSYISENLERVSIRPSSPATGAPVIFCEKKDGGLHLCVDYYKCNSVTRKIRYPVPPMKQLLTIFNGSTIFSKIDLCGAYDLLRIEEGDGHLTAVRTKYGSYE